MHCQAIKTLSSRYYSSRANYMEDIFGEQYPTLDNIQIVLKILSIVSFYNKYLIIGNHIIKYLFGNQKVFLLLEKNRDYISIAIANKKVHTI